MRALVKVGYACNHACCFCHAQRRRGVEAPRSEVEARIDRAARLGHTMVVLSGGEPTLRPELLDWAARVSGLGMDFGLVTNGTMLDRALVDSLLRSRLRYLHVSLHGGTAALHDALVGASGFRRVIRTLEAASGHGLELWVNCVVTSRNVQALGDVVETVRRFPDAALKLSLVEPRGAALDGFEDLVPRVTLAAERIREAIAAARDGDPPLRVAHDFVPLCLLPGAEDLRGDLRAHGFWTMAEVGEPDLFPVDERNLVKPALCAPCVLRGRCPGLFTSYHARFGDGELRPVVGGTRSNSFHWVYEGRVVASGAACPVLALGVHPWDRGRHLFVRNEDRVGRFRTETRDFCDEDVADVKHRSEQVYLDASGKDAPDDFARQLVKLRRATACSGCEHLDGCTGLFEPIEGNVFLRDEARLLEILRSLEGDVLDVGCGEVPYAQALDDAARARRIRYTGIEPDPDRARRFCERWPWAEVLQAPAEQLDLGGRTFDHVLVLRSWNHLRDPALVVARIAAALRPGGTFTVADNEAFGLARTRAEARRAEASSAAFEHFRNDGAAQAEAVVARGKGAGALRLVERRDVGPETSNQWLLRYVSAPAGAL